MVSVILTPLPSFGSFFLYWAANNKYGVKLLFFGAIARDVIWLSSAHHYSYS
jgi:hypothetical protein